jgi:outer membrane protein OmpA-like peptidoglycan-associated protein
VDQGVCAKLKEENFDENQPSQDAGSPGTFDPAKNWDKLQPVAGLKLDPIFFKSGSFDLSRDSIDQLEKVVENLKLQSDYYLEIQGSTLKDKKDTADIELAKSRVEEVFKWLRDKGGVEEKRMKMQPTIAAGDGTVSFVFKKPPR